MSQNPLVGIGLYTPAEAERLIRVPAQKIARWLRGHKIGNKWYEPLWKPQIDIEDEGVFLGFRDLIEIRVAHAFMDYGVSAVRVRRAIEVARRDFGLDHPLSTTRFKTDGRTIFLEIAEEEGRDPRLLELFSKQYAFKQIIAASLKDLDFDDRVVPSRWWPRGRSKGIVVDPNRAFGRPVEATTGIPTAILANAAQAEGSVEQAAKVWSVAPAAIRAAVEFESMAIQQAA
jgi:uncharacterized protein (DUF433 family)